MSEIVKYTYSEAFFTSYDGVDMFYRAWIPIDKVKAYVIFSHGIVEHSETYEHLGKALSEHGFAMFSMDARGHGRSGEKCAYKDGYVERFDDFIEDLKIFFNKIVNPQASGLPVFISGHSMGSIISMNYIIKYPSGIKGLTLVSTGASFNTASKIMIMISKVLGKIFPNASLKLLYPKKAFKNNELMYKTVISPYTPKRLYAKIGIALSNGLKHAVKNAGKIKLPLFFQHSTRDWLFKKQKELFDNFGSEDKTRIFYEKQPHEIYKSHAPFRLIAINDLIDWLNKHS